MDRAPRILLVDDDEDTFVIVRRFLGGAGSPRYELQWASTFEEGLSRIETSSYDAVLIDYRLGARDGLDLLDQAVASGLTAPFIILTGKGGRPIDIEAMHRGAADYLAKDHLDSETLDRSIRYAVERRRLMDDLRDHADELTRRAEELQQMNDSLEQFVWAASHDLQTPLRTIIYRLQHLKMKHGGELAKDESIDSAAQAAKHMSILLHDLLHYVRSGSEEFSMAPVDCAKLVAEAMEYITLDSESVSPQIRVDSLPTVIANRSMLGQVLQHLLQNAVVHADRRQMHVRISATRKDSNWLFRVENDGAGVDPAEQEVIFQPFQRSGRSHHTSGSGIGLALCRRIIERHGGRIWYESKPGEGEAFLFTIPDPDDNADGRNKNHARQAA